MINYQVSIFGHFHQTDSILGLWKIFSNSSAIDVLDNDRISRLILKELRLNRFFRLIGVLFCVTRDCVLSEWFRFAWDIFL